MPNYLVGYRNNAHREALTQHKTGVIDVVEADYETDAIEQVAQGPGDYFAVEVTFYPVKLKVA